GVQGRKIGRIDGGDHIGKLEAYPLEFAYRLTELLAFSRPARGVVEGPPRPTDRGRCHRQAGAREPLVHRLETAPEFTEDLDLGDAAVLEAQDDVLIAAMRNGIV